MRIPDYEMNVLLLAETEAMDLAREGKVMEGHRCLQAGLRRVEEGQDLSEPWFEELVTQWKRAIAAYARRHGSSLIE